MIESEEKIMVARIMGDTVEYGAARAGQEYGLVTIIDDSYCIHDPRYDNNGFSPVDDGHYGYPSEAIEALVNLNVQLIEAQNKFFDQAVSLRDETVSLIQTDLGQTEGDLASHHFSDDDDLQKQSVEFGEKLAAYGLQEFSSKYEYNPSLKLRSSPT